MDQCHIPILDVDTDSFCCGEMSVGVREGGTAQDSDHVSRIKFHLRHLLPPYYSPGATVDT